MSFASGFNVGSNAVLAGQQVRTSRDRNRREGERHNLIMQDAKFQMTSKIKARHEQIFTTGINYTLSQKGKVLADIESKQDILAEQGLEGSPEFKELSTRWSKVKAEVLDTTTLLNNQLHHMLRTIPDFDKHVGEAFGLEGKWDPSATQGNTELDGKNPLAGLFFNEDHNGKLSQTPLLNAAQESPETLDGPKRRRVPMRGPSELPKSTIVPMTHNRTSDAPDVVRPSRSCNRN